MRQVFADTAYWLALTNPFDQYHEKALQASTSLGRARIVTTDSVLTEYLNALADKGEAVRYAAIRSVEAILRDTAVTVAPQTRKSFLEGFGLYKSRPDKGYSLTDCISMTLMRRRKISQALTTDRHFAQEGFVALLGHNTDSRKDSRPLFCSLSTMAKRLVNILTIGHQVKAKKEYSDHENDGQY